MTSGAARPEWMARVLTAVEENAHEAFAAFAPPVDP